MAFSLFLNSMRNLITYLALILVVLISCSNQGRLFPAEDPFAIPFCSEIVIDGDVSDWNDVGLIIPLISNLYGEIDSYDFTAEMRLSWDEEQLYFMALIKDDSLFEHNSPLRGDGMELFISQEKGTGKIIKYIISPGVTNKFVAPRIDKYDYVKKGTESDVDDLDVFTSTSEGGYTIEGAIPWEEVGIVPGSGVKWALNFYLSDVDPGQRKTRYALYFNQDNSTNYFALQEMELDTSSWQRPVPMMVKAYIEDRSTYKVLMFSDLGSEGLEVRIKDGKGFKRKLTLEENNGIAIASIDIPLKDIDPSAHFLDVDLDHKYHTSLFFRDFSNRYVNIEKPHNFEDEILFYEELDKINFPLPNSTLFIGSSSIRLWGTSIVEDFKGMKVLCRGFGGSTTEDALYYFNRMITPYNPSVIILAEGSNDLARGVSPEAVVESTREFIENTASVLPDCRVIILSIKVSVARKKVVGTVLTTNEMLQEMVHEYDNAEYVDVVTEMMTEEGKVRGDIFSADSLHMNNSGYEIWTRILTPVLKN